VNFDLILQGSGADVLGIVNLGTGTLNLAGKTGGSVTVNGALSTGAMTTVGNAYNITLNGGGTISGAVATTFQQHRLADHRPEWLHLHRRGAEDGGRGQELRGHHQLHQRGAELRTAGAITLTAGTTFSSGTGAITLFDLAAVNFDLILQGSGADVLGIVNLGTGT